MHVIEHVRVTLRVLCLLCGCSCEDNLFKLTEEVGVMYRMHWDDAVEKEVAKFEDFAVAVETGLESSKPWRSVGDLCQGIASTRDSLDTFPRGFTADGYHCTWHFRTTAIVLASMLEPDVFSCQVIRLAWRPHVHRLQPFHVVTRKCGTPTVSCACCGVIWA